MDDLISRQDTQERQHVAQKRRYSFGNDEFSLEAAYHDCKLVFDGITDDDSFQKADTGLILYYANEIIYALHKALEGVEQKQPEQQWTPCSVAPPKDEEEVIVSVHDDSGDNTFDYSSCGWYACAGDFWVVNNEPNYHVIAWAPMPKPYKEEVKYDER